MRKKIFILIYFILTQIIFAYDFSCIVDSEATIRPYRNSTYVETTDKFANQKILVSTDEVLDSGYLLVKDYNSKIYIDSRNLKLENSYFFDEIFKNKKWLLKTCVDALYNSDPSLVYEYTGNVKDYVIKNQNSMDFPEYTWDEYVGPVFIEHDGLFFEISEKPKSFASFVSLNFLILNIDDSYFTIYIDYIYNTYDFALKYYELNTDEVYKFKYQLDGDYLNLYLDDELFISFVNADASLIQEYTDFIKEKNYLLANVKWPKHANGSCDYDDEIKPPKVQLSDNDSVAEEKEDSATPTDTFSENEEDVKTVEETVPSVKKTSSLPLVIIVVSAVIVLLLCVVIILIVRKI